MQECQSLYVLKGSTWVGQHARKSTAQTRKTLISGVGQHAGTVGQHKQEWWVNMVRNLQGVKRLTRIMALQAFDRVSCKPLVIASIQFTLYHVHIEVHKRKKPHN